MTAATRDSLVTPSVQGLRVGTRLCVLDPPTGDRMAGKKKDKKDKKGK
jgi:hypothetical protein